MENMPSEAASSSALESSSIGLQAPSVLPEHEALEFSTTVDPGYIIQLIRQLLPPAYMNNLGKHSSANVLQNDLRKDKHSAQEEQGTNLHVLDGMVNIKEKVYEHSRDKDSDLGGRGENIDEISSKSADIREEFCKKLDPTNLPAQKGEVCHSDAQSPCPSSNHTCEDGQPPPREGSVPRPGVSPKRAMDHSVTEPTAASEVLEERREEAGCMLWDLAANQTHAEFMVGNHTVDVLLAILNAPHSDRIREICLGIMGNLACHAVPVKALIETPGLLKVIVENLFVDDSPSLSEACRLLSAGLHSEEVDSWVKVINSEEVLERIIWIAANTMNSLLLEKSSELLLAMVDCQGDTASILLSALVRLGLPAVLTDLLDSEISAINEGTCSHGNIVLDTLLQIAEALSLADDYATQLAANHKLFSLACQVIRMSGKDEVGSAGISATVLVANLLAEDENLIKKVSCDAPLIKQLLELLPFAGDDPGAQNALWSILARLSYAYATNFEDSSATSEVLLVLAERVELLLEDLQDHRDDQMEDPAENGSTRGFKAKLETVNKFLHIMEAWSVSHDPDVEIYETIKSSCCLMKRRLAETELNGDAEHSTEFNSHENGYVIPKV